MSSLKVLLLLEAIQLITGLQCFEAFKSKTGGIITNLNYSYGGQISGSCSYTVFSVTNFIEVHLIEFTVPDLYCYDEECCYFSSLSLVTHKDSYLLCSHNITSKSYEFESSQLNISYVSPVTNFPIKIMYTTSKKCRGNQYECIDHSFCYYAYEICDGSAHCADQSDETNCSRNYCQEDLYFQCYSGECIPRRLVNNGVSDCVDNSDEDHTNKNYIFFISLSLLMAFTLIVCKWYMSRGDRRAIEDFPDFPLPPFQGPGEGVGDELFEAFAENRRRRDSSKRCRIKYVRPCKPHEAQMFELSNGDDSVTALASLSVDVDSCIGLSKDDFRRLEKTRSSTATSSYVKSEAL